MSIRIISVAAGSPAERAGLKAGDIIETIGGEEVLDEIDYQALTSRALTDLVYRDPSGAEKSCRIRKHDWEGLGLTLDESVILKPRPCRNHCVFCFIDQMPPNMRETLYVKDDDWRLSLMMGNYVTLTNVSDAEFSRIIRRHASPLYISVHATDPDLRVRMMKNPRAGELMGRLRQLAAHGISFHCQIVLCPGLNDGDALLRSIRDLRSLWPAARSLALVPVGLTCHREGLETLTPYDAGRAKALLDFLQPVQEMYLRELGTRFVFPSDEFYCLSGREIPPEEHFENYPQIENGVGMLRQLESEMAESLEWDELPAPPDKQALIIATGVSAAPFIRKLCSRFAPEGTEVRVIPVTNRFFGETVTVTGLITGRDLLHALEGVSGDRLLIAGNMLRENEDCFLDDVTLTEIRAALPYPVQAVQNNGSALLRALYTSEE